MVQLGHYHIGATPPCAFLSANLFFIQKLF